MSQPLISELPLPRAWTTCMYVFVGDCSGRQALLTSWVKGEHLHAATALILLSFRSEGRKRGGRGRSCT